jgi:Carboxypeptidase regulatory-like domain
MTPVVFILTLVLQSPASGLAQATGDIAGRATDQTGGVLPGVSVEVRSTGGRWTAWTDGQGNYRLDGLAPGVYDLTASIINFATFSARGVIVRPGARTTVDPRLTLSVTADVTVTGHRSFVNLADVEDPASNLVGVALAASQGAVTAKQLDVRSMMRAGEVLETVPGLIISQHR